MTNAQSKHSDLFLSGFSESWFTFALRGFYQEQFIVYTIIIWSPFCIEELIDFGFQVTV